MGAQSKPRKLAVDVWQFVRMMVELERKPAPGGAYDAWREAWHEIDRRLEELGRSDAEAFAELMMNHRVVLTADSRQREEAAAALDAVIAQMDKVLRSEGDARRRADLGLERTALAALRQRLRRPSRAHERSPAPRQAGRGKPRKARKNNA